MQMRYRRRRRRRRRRETDLYRRTAYEKNDTGIRTEQIYWDG
jgi:hypothetical protein